MKPQIRYKATIKAQIKNLTIPGIKEDPEQFVPLFSTDKSIKVYINFPKLFVNTYKAKYMYTQ